jgi:hypothetical protein
MLGQPKNPGKMRCITAPRVLAWRSFLYLPTMSCESHLGKSAITSTSKEQIKSNVVNMKLARSILKRSQS